MPCFNQMLAVPVPNLSVTAKSPISFKFLGNYSDFRASRAKLPEKFKLLPCGQCIGCKLEKSRQWATRLLHEKANYEKACFLTLTYDEDNLPEGKTLIPDHLSTFFKDLRSRLSYHGKEKLKYFAIGEYGTQTARPHYHAALFGPFSSDLSDPSTTQEKPARSGSPQYSNTHISACWPHGLHRYSELTFESAAYVARYCLKKFTGPTSPLHYNGRHPEFLRSSNGLGKSHLFKEDGSPQWLSDVYPSDHVVLPGRGQFMPPPYYDRLLQKADEALFEAVKQVRREAHEKMTLSELGEHTENRHRGKAYITHVTGQTLIRGID